MHLLPISWQYDKDKVLKVTAHTSSAENQEVYDEFISKMGPFNSKIEAATVFALFVAIPSGEA